MTEEPAGRLNTRAIPPFNNKTVKCVEEEKECWQLQVIMRDCR